MDWMNQVAGLLSQIEGQGTAPAPEQHDAMGDLLHQLPQSELTNGLAAAFRSNDTPPFGNMVAQMFSNSNGEQKSSLLNSLLPALGPIVLQQVLGGGNQAGANASPLGAIANQLLSGQQQTVSPEQAEHFTPEAVAQLAAHAEKQDPSIVDEISGFYSAHPTLVKTLGAAALTIALSQLSKRSS